MPEMMSLVNPKSQTPAVAPSMPALFKWFVSLLVLTGIFASWEPGPELIGHSHAHVSGHEFQPLHEILPLTAGDPEDRPNLPSSNSAPQDFHYHVLFDFGSETCSDRHVEKFQLPDQTRLYAVGTDDCLPESLSAEVEHPPLIT